MREIAYIGEHVKIKDDRYALDPRVIAKILNLANVSDTDLVLNIGGCYGYLATLLSFSAQAVVLTEELEIARDAESILVEQAIDNVIVKAAPLVDGANDYGPYDVIIIEGGVEFIPETIFNQLKIGGRVVAIFIDGLVGECRLGFRTLETIDWRFGFNAVAPILRGFMKETDFVF